jgi:curved DNA-binding protein
LNFQLPITRKLNETNNLYATVDINFFKALLGREITMDTFKGKVKLNVKPESQSGTKVKLTGKGFPIHKKKGEFGYLYITYNLELPATLSEK